MNVHRLSASTHGRTSRFRDSSRMARCSRVNSVAIQRGLQKNGGPHAADSTRELVKALNHADGFKEEVRPAVHFSYLGSVISGAKIGAM
jgi:DNA-binding phage protein